MIIELNGGTKLDFFKDLFHEAKSSLEEIYTKLDQHYEQYKGSKVIDGSSVEATHVWNITYELLESQNTTYIPTASVTPEMQSDRSERNAKSIEVLLSNLRDKLNFEKMNDIDERHTYIYGSSIWLVEWDQTRNSGIGDVKISCISPKHFVGQPNIYNLDDMEYCFLLFETTKEDIVRRYGVTPDVAEDTESEDSADDKTATVYVCYYKDDSGKICEYVWSGDTELLDIEDYYARKRKICKHCGETEDKCVCDVKRKSQYVLTNEDEETIYRDIVLSDGVIPAMCEVIENGQKVYETVKQQMYEPDGSMAFDMVDGQPVPLMTEVEVPKLQQTKIPFYAPTVFPIVIRKNTSEEDALFGQSDCEFIRPQQQAINKIESRILQKLLYAGITPMVPEDATISISNAIFGQVIKLKPGETAAQYGTIDNTPNISQDIAEAERLYDHAKRMLGISDSFQGQYDSSATSGVAKRLQIQQAAGRLDSKRAMKNAAYADLDKIIFQLYLAYADEPRTSTYRDANGRLQNAMFNRYDFVERDEAGNWYYNDAYMFKADASVDIDKSREVIWQENRQNFQSGAYGDPGLPQTQLIFWQNMERAHYPWASDNVERIRAEIQTMAEMNALRENNEKLSAEVNQRAMYETSLLEEIKNLKGVPQ